MKISVIVPVAHDRRLVRCLRGLFQQTIEPEAYEVLVVDNGPSDEIRRSVAEFPARYLVFPGRGSYAARNHGIEEARGQVLAFTDADALPPPRWLSTICALFEGNELDAAAGPSHALNRDPVGRLVQMVDDERWLRLARERRLTYCDTRNLAGRHELFRKEPFDPDFKHGGDLEWGLRVSRAGYRIRFVSEMVLGHENVSGFPAVIRRGVRRGRGVAAVYHKYGPHVQISGARPLRLLGIDIKAPMLALLTHAAVRPVAVAGVAAGTLFVAGLLAAVLRTPLPPSRAFHLFWILDRASLLLGRLLGA